MIEPDVNADQLCNWLLEQDPSLVLRLLYEVWVGARQAPEGFHWLGLAEISAGLLLWPWRMTWTTGLTISRKRFTCLRP